MSPHAAFGWASGMPLHPQRSCGTHRTRCCSAPPPPPAHAPIEVSGVSMWWGDGTPVLRDMSVSVGAGELAMVAGANGCGKSTLLTVARGLVLPQRGCAHVHTPCAFVWQDPQRQILLPSVGMNVAAAVAAARRGHPGWKSVTPADVRARVDECLEAVGLQPADYVNRPARELSGGEKQRVAVATALAMEPRCMLLDEITASVDPANRALLLEVVPRMVRERGIAALWVTHSRDELEMGDVIYLMNRGALVASGPPSDILPIMDEDYQNVYRAPATEYDL